jgi:hypothetical protein
MKNCKNCGKKLSPNAQKPGTTSLCITCFNKGRKGKLNPRWKEECTNYSSLHQWIRKQFPRPDVCEICKIGFPIDLANISQEYKRDLSDWEWLCRRCHMTKDGRLTSNRYKESTEVVHPLLMKMRIDNRIERKERRVRNANRL